MATSLTPPSSVEGAIEVVCYHLLARYAHEHTFLHDGNNKKKKKKKKNDQVGLFMETCSAIIF